MLVRGGDPPDPPARRPRRFRFRAVGLVGVGLWFLAVDLPGRRSGFPVVGLSARGPVSCYWFGWTAWRVSRRWPRWPVVADSRFLESGRRGARWVFGGTIGRQSLYVMARSLMVAPLMQGRQDYSAGTKEIFMLL